MMETSLICEGEMRFWLFQHKHIRLLSMTLEKTTGSHIYIFFWDSAWCKKKNPPNCSRWWFQKRNTAHTILMIDARGNSRKRISIIWASCLGYVCAVWFSPVWHVVKYSRPWLRLGSSKQKKNAPMWTLNERVQCNPSQKESWMDLRNKNCYALSDVTLFLLVNLFRTCTSCCTYCRKLLPGSGNILETNSKFLHLMNFDGEIMKSQYFLALEPATSTVNFPFRQ